MGLLKTIAKGVFGSNKPQEPEKPEEPKQSVSQPEQTQQPAEQPVEQPQQSKEVNGEDLLPDAQTADTDAVTPSVNAAQINASSQLSANAAATTASKFLGSAKHRPENLKEKSSNIVNKIKRGI